MSRSHSSLTTQHCSMPTRWSSHGGSGKSYYSKIRTTVREGIQDFWPLTVLYFISPDIHRSTLGNVIHLATPFISYVISVVFIFLSVRVQIARTIPVNITGCTIFVRTSTGIIRGTIASIIVTNYITRTSKILVSAMHRHGRPGGCHEAPTRDGDLCGVFQYVSSTARRFSWILGHP